jgi:AraC-like DNA-binding protein
MVYMDRGECEILAGDRCFELHQGEIYFHKPYEKHMLKVIKGICPNVFIITFESSSPAMSYFDGRKIEADINTKQHISAIIHEASGTFDLPFNDPCANELYVRSGNSLWAGDQSTLLRLELMLIELARRTDDKPSGRVYNKEIITDEFCLKVIEYMEQKIYEKINMEDMSHALSFSKSYIYKRFVNSCGCSVVDYFTIMKINEAKRLIRETKKNFFEISETLHFSNSHYFSTVFKKETGKTFISYLTDYRLDRAVELLRSTPDKTYMIARQVGYSDSNYFSYVFKKKYGISQFLRSFFGSISPSATRSRM